MTGQVCDTYTSAGTTVLRPFEERRMPRRPPAHQSTPRETCCMSLWLHLPPRCSAKVLTMPQSMMTLKTVSQPSCVWAE